MKRALLSVFDKTGIIQFATDLRELGFELISTGGTKDALQSAGIPVVPINEYTDFPEIFDGRVKTLHPRIHGGLLAKRDHATHQQQMIEHGIVYIDLVCVNLYPFAQTVANSNATQAEIIENIDIGGPTMLRSAAKNFQDVTVLVDSKDYQLVMNELREEGKTALATRQKLAGKVFNHTAGYNALIAEYFNQLNEIDMPDQLTKTYQLKQLLRYGENPHQQAAFYETVEKKSAYSVTQSEQIHGKELSYNNIADANAALEAISEFDEPAVIVIKHMNPCGVGFGMDIEAAFQKAYEADPISIFGGIVAFNRPLTAQLAQKLNDIFLEIIIAPRFEAEALAMLQKKKNIRLLLTTMTNKIAPRQQLVSVNGGLLLQHMDTVQMTAKEMTTVTKTLPDEETIRQMQFGMQVVKHVKSNAIVIVKDGMTVGIGAGQMNRVGAAKIALEQAGEKAQGAYLASDAFFPMPDTVELAAKYGIKAIIQPGGSIKDADSIDACNQHGIVMVMTGHRHFKH